MVAVQEATIPDEDGTIHRRDFAADVSERTGLRFELVDQVLVAFLDAVADALAERRKVSLRNFGVFEPRDRGATIKVKPDTGQPIHVPPSPAVGFRPSPVLKRRMRGHVDGNRNDLD